MSNELSTNKVLRCLNREWKSKVTAIKEANDLKVLDLTTLFGKLEEHEQELSCLEKHEKRKNEKGKDKEERKKSIALKTFTLRPSQDEQKDSEPKDDKDSDEEDMGLFIKRVNKYMSKNGDKYLNKYCDKSRRLSSSSKEEDERKKGKSRSTC